MEKDIGKTDLFCLEFLRCHHQKLNHFHSLSAVEESTKYGLIGNYSLNQNLKHAGYRKESAVTRKRERLLLPWCHET